MVLEPDHFISRNLGKMILGTLLVYDVDPRTNGLLNEVREGPGRIRDDDGFNHGRKVSPPGQLLTDNWLVFLSSYISFSQSV